MLCAKYDYDLDIQVKQEEAFEEGLEKGIVQGIAQGISQGLSQERIETAKRMLAENFNIDMISKITNLSAEEIETLAHESV